MQTILEIKNQVNEFIVRVDEYNSQMSERSRIQAVDDAIGVRADIRRQVDDIHDLVVNRSNSMPMIDRQILRKTVKSLRRVEDSISIGLIGLIDNTLDTNHEYKELKSNLLGSLCEVDHMMEFGIEAKSFMKLLDAENEKSNDNDQHHEMKPEFSKSNTPSYSPSMGM